MRAGISCSLKLNSESKIFPLRSCARVPSSFSASRAIVPFGCELSNSGMLINVSFYGLVSGPWPTRYGSSTISRSYSQIAKASTRNRIITMEGGSSGKNNPVNTFNKRRKSPKAFAAQKGNAASKEELATSSSSGKAAAVEYDVPSSIKDRTVNDQKNSIVDNGGREKPKQSRKNNKQSQSSSVSASTEAAEMPDSSKKVSGAKEIRKSKSKQSHISPEVRCKFFLSSLIGF